MQKTPETAPRSTNRRALTIESQTTAMGNRRHALRTRNAELANALYERALDAGHEPEIERAGRAFVIDFYATDADLHATLQGVAC